MVNVAIDTGSNDMSVSVIIPTYNRANYLLESIGSVLAQTLPPEQVIVVDDGSKDNTREIVVGLLPRVEYLVKPNGGKSSALNLALRHAIGRFILVLDDDDIAAPDALRQLVKALDEHPECGFAFGHYDFFRVNADGKRETTQVARVELPPDCLFARLMERSVIQQGAMLVRKSCYDEVGPFDETLVRSQDYEMLLRLTQRYLGARVDVLAFHARQHSGIRGSEASPIRPDRAVETWIGYDRKILTRICETHDLRDFLPRNALRTELTSEEQFEALLQRSCIMARRGVWEKSAADLRQASEIAERSGKATLTKSQREILRRFFDLFSFAPHTFDNAGAFCRALDEIKSRSLEREVRANLIWSLPFTIGAVLSHGQHANARHFLAVYLKLATPLTALRSIASRSFFENGLELLRMRGKSEYRDPIDVKSISA